MGAAVKPLRSKVTSRMSIRRARVEKLRWQLEQETDEKCRQMIQAQLVALDPPSRSMSCRG